MSKEEGAALREKRKKHDTDRISQKVKSEEREVFLGEMAQDGKAG
jgi:hypothetical protein